MSDRILLDQDVTYVLLRVENSSVVQKHVGL